MKPTKPAPNPGCPRCAVPMDRLPNAGLRCTSHLHGLPNYMDRADGPRAALRKVWAADHVLRELFPARYAKHPLSGGSTAAPVLQQPPAPLKP